MKGSETLAQPFGLKSMIPTIDDLRDNPSFQFKPGNKAKFLMDFGMWEGLPSDRQFYLWSHGPKDMYVTLVADGYGMKGSYGNGSIFIHVNELLGKCTPELILHAYELARGRIEPVIKDLNDKLSGEYAKLAELDQIRAASLSKEREGA